MELGELPSFVLLGHCLFLTHCLIKTHESVAYYHMHAPPCVVLSNHVYYLFIFKRTFYIRRWFPN